MTPGVTMARTFVPIEGVSCYGFVTWARAGIVAATYTHGRKVQLCTVAQCEHCCITWRQKPEARTCDACSKPLVVTESDEPVQSKPPPVWCRSVHPDLETGEPRLHIDEYESCSAACKDELLKSLPRTYKTNDIVDAKVFVDREQYCHAYVPQMC